MDEQETIRAAMSIMGRRRTPRRQASVAENFAKSPARKPGYKIPEEQRAKMAEAQRKRRPAPVCNCHTDPHKSSCPVAVAEYNRRYYERKQAQKSA